MKLSIITSVLNSHEIVRRQQTYLKSLNLSNDVEIIYIDDGSTPPLGYNDYNTRPRLFKILVTNEYRNFTEHIARNKGAREAKGNYLLFIDIDYILTEEAINTALDFTGDMMHFTRRFGILDWDGRLNYDKQVLKAYGLKDKWIKRKSVPGHRSQFLIRNDLFQNLGGYNEKLDGKWRRTGGAGEKFWRKIQRFNLDGKIRTSNVKPVIFMFPNGKFCDFELPIFYKLQHETKEDDMNNKDKRKLMVGSSNKMRRRMGSINKLKRHAGNTNKTKRKMVNA